MKMQSYAVILSNMKKILIKYESDMNQIWIKYT